MVSYHCMKIAMKEYYVLLIKIKIRWEYVCILIGFSISLSHLMPLTTRLVPYGDADQMRLICIILPALHGGVLLPRCIRPVLHVPEEERAFRGLHQVSRKPAGRRTHQTRKEVWSSCERQLLPEVHRDRRSRARWYSLRRRSWTSHKCCFNRWTGNSITSQMAIINFRIAQNFCW